MTESSSRYPCPVCGKGVGCNSVQCTDYEPLSLPQQQLFETTFQWPIV